MPGNQGKATNSMTIGDPRFFARGGPHPLGRVAKAANGAAPPEADLLLAGVAPLHAAGPEEVSFLDNRRYAAALAGTAAGAVIVHPDMLARVPPGTRPIVTAEPYAGWARVAALFHPAPPLRPGVHPTAAVAEDARVDPSAEIVPFTLVEAGAEVGARCRGRIVAAPDRRSGAGGRGPRGGGAGGRARRGPLSRPMNPFRIACAAGDAPQVEHVGGQPVECSLPGGAASMGRGEEHRQGGTPWLS